MSGLHVKARRTVVRDCTVPKHTSTACCARVCLKKSSSSSADKDLPEGLTTGSRERRPRTGREPRAAREVAFEEALVEQRAEENTWVNT